MQKATSHLDHCVQTADQMNVGVVNVGIRKKKMQRRFLGKRSQKDRRGRDQARITSRKKVSTLKARVSIKYNRGLELFIKINLLAR